MFLPETQNYVYVHVYCRISVISVWTINIECAMTIFGQCYNVLNNNILDIF